MRFLLLVVTVNKTIVFVYDYSVKEYFSQLLKIAQLSGVWGDIDRATLFMVGVIRSAHQFIMALASEAARYVNRAIPFPSDDCE
jgi:hypothetical protein